MLKNSLKLFLAVVSILVTGCNLTSNVDLVIANEAEKIGKIQLGMTVNEVKKIMGVEKIVFEYGGTTSYASRPIRVDKFTDKSGSPIDVYYYRSSTKKRDGISTDDETTAVIFLNGKVDAITSGDTSKTVIEVRTR
jgi:hypothetical protein